MSRKDYVPVGGILTRTNGKKYEVVPFSNCIHCAFYNRNSLWCTGMLCDPDDRDDKVSVIFLRRKDLETV